MDLDMKRITNLTVSETETVIYTEPTTSPTPQSKNFAKPERLSKTTSMEIKNTSASPWESRWNLIAAKGLLRKLLANVPNNIARVVPSTLNPQV
jgi:hypothetical protein